MKGLGILVLVALFNLLLILCVIVNTNCGSEIVFDTNNNNFVIHGKWKSGRRYEQTCNFILEEKCCPKKQKNIHFEFHDPRLNTINPLEELRKILKHKKLLLIGDSLMLEFFRGLAELLHVKSSAERGANYSGNRLLEGQKSFIGMERFRITSEKTIRKEIADHDIVFFNQGLHYGGKFLLKDSVIYFNNMGQMLHGKNFHFCTT